LVSCLISVIMQILLDSSVFIKRSKHSFNIFFANLRDLLGFVLEKENEYNSVI